MVFFPVMLVIGNCLLTYPPESINFVNGELFKSHIIRNKQINDTHLIARKIAQIKGDKIVFTNLPLRPYILYEFYSMIPNLEITRVGDNCYTVNNDTNILCFFTSMDEKDMLNLIRKKVNSNNWEAYTIISTFYNLKQLKDEGFRVIDNEDIRSWTKIPPPVVS